MRTLTLSFGLLLLPGVISLASAETSSERDVRLMGLAIEQSKIGAQTRGGGPIGAVVADADGKVIGRGFSQIGRAHDPTAHAEMVAIRQAARQIRSSNLKAGDRKRERVRSSGPGSKTFLTALWVEKTNGARR